MNVENLLNAIKNPVLSKKLNKEEKGILLDFYKICSELVYENSVFLEWQQYQEYWMRPVFEYFGFVVTVEIEDGEVYGISISRKDV